MQTRQELLLDVMGEQDTRFVIPAYQRTYSWTTSQCDELWRDILRAARAKRSHFVGMVIFARDVQSRLMVVDGQQRLVTTTLMLLAFARFMNAHGLAFFGMDASYMRDTYLMACGKAKLVLSRTDRQTLDALIVDAPLPQHASRTLIENLRHFEELMQADTFDAEHFWRGLRSLLVITTELEESDHPQAVFESLNSKGIALTTADLVRNHLLVSLSHREQKRLYEEYWEPIQGAFGDDPGSLRLNNAIRGWLAVRCRTARSHSDRDAFSVFKIYCEDEYAGSIDDLLAELRSFALMWAENFRYHATKKYKSYDWATIGPKTLVSDRRIVLSPEDQKLYEYYRRHFGVNPQW